MSQLQQHSAASVIETRVEIDVSSQLAEHIGELAPIEGSLHAALEYLCTRLGIPGTLELAVRVADAIDRADKPIIVRVNRHRLQYSRELSMTLAQYLGCQLDEPHCNPERLFEYIAHLALHVVKGQPAVLLGPTHVAAYRGKLWARGYREAADSPYLESALKLALSLWSSIEDIDAVGSSLSDAATRADEAESVESVVKALRSSDIEIHLPLAYLRELTERTEEWTSGFSELRSTLARELGIALPPFSFVLDEELRRENEEQAQSFCFKFNALTTPPIRGLAVDDILVNDTVDHVHRPDSPAVATVNAARGRSAAIVKSDQQQRLETAGYVTWNARQYLLLCLGDSIRARAASLLDQSIVEDLITTLRQQAPKLCDVIDALYSMAEVTGVLRELLADRISIRNLHRICNLLADADHQPSFVDRVNLVRAGMREISHHLSRSTTVVPVYLLDLPIVELLERAQSTGLDETSETALTAAIQSELNYLPDITPPAILATPKSRALLQAILSAAFPRVAVTTLAELGDEVGIQPIARITM